MESMTPVAPVPAAEMTILRRVEAEAWRLGGEGSTEVGSALIEASRQWAQVRAAAQPWEKLLLAFWNELAEEYSRRFLMSRE